ncbi:YjbH domain-containing protein, partial [Enterobacter cloacae]
ASGRGYRIRADRFSYSVKPTLAQSLGGPEDFYMFQVGVMASASYWLTDRLLLDGGVFANLYNNYDKFKSSLLPADSSLPRVRTHIRDYVSNDAYINNLQANYVDALGNGFYAQIYGGYLETMDGGVGAGAAWRPLDSDWALGVDAKYVKQRDWDDMMRFTDYSVPTGFITTYWNPAKLNSVLMKLSVGQYLAKDKGATLDVAKRFDSGVTVGVWAALTNVSKEDYGEGGFSKGFYISIPLDLMTIGPNRNRAVVSWTPLTRDGGQMLGRKYQLYDMTSERETPVGQ